MIRVKADMESVGHKELPMSKKNTETRRPGCRCGATCACGNACACSNA